MKGLLLTATALVFIQSQQQAGFQKTLTIDR